MRGKSGLYLISVFVFLCCMTTAVHAINQSQISKSTVFIDTDISNGTGFYVKSNLIATSLHIISEAESISVLADGKDLGFQGVAKYDARRNLALLRVKVEGTPLELDWHSGLEPNQDIYIAARISASGKRFKPTRTSPSGTADLCHVGAKFPIILEFNSDGGPVLNISGKVVGVFFVGTLEWEYELAGLNYSFVVPALDLNNLMSGSLDVITTPITVELDYCALISRARARARKADRVGSMIVNKPRNLANDDLRKASSKLERVIHIAKDDILPVLKRICQIF